MHCGDRVVEQLLLLKCGSKERNELETLRASFETECRATPEFGRIGFGEESAECVDAAEVWGHAAV
jgi:hypothetical protein